MVTFRCSWLNRHPIDPRSLYRHMVNRAAWKRAPTEEESVETVINLFIRNPRTPGSGSTRANVYCTSPFSLFFFFFPFSIAPHRIFCDRISSILEPSTRAAKSIREKVSNYEIPLLDYSRRNRVHVTRKVSNEFFSLIILANVVEQISLPPSPSFNSSREIVQ